MRRARADVLKSLFAVVVLLWLAHASPHGQAEEVVRVSAELVQTDVTVLDKRGRPVEGLAREQFELKVNGRPVELSFFEGVAAGSPEEEAKLAAAPGRLSLSSVFVGEVRPGARPHAQSRAVSVSVGRRFARGSRLRFQTFVYGAAGAAVGVRARVVRDGVTALSLDASASEPAPARDPARLGYAGELELEGLGPGRYVLEVTAEAAGGGAKPGAAREVVFVVD